MIDFTISAYNGLTLPVVIFFIINGFIHLYYAIKLHQKFPKEHNFPKSIAVVLLWIIAGLIYPFFYSTENEKIQFFQGLTIFFLCGFTPFMIALVLYYQYRKVKDDPEVRKRRCLVNFFKEFEQKSGGLTDIMTHTFRTDFHRKVLHLFPASVILILWLFAVYVWADMWNGSEIWGISGPDFGVFLIITAGYSGIFVFACLDYIRLSCIYERGNFFWILPDNVLDLLGKAIKRKEFYEFIGPTVLVISFVPVFLLVHWAFGLFAAAMLIATIGDGFASLFGIKFGKHPFPKNSHKTVEGYVAGFLGSFGIALLALIVFESQEGIVKLVLVALTGAIVFLITDLMSLKVDDNILNPIFCGYTMALSFFLL
ncbi:MAG: diacylglycerol/polyprenol kinase family protein [Promethearchaeota archaeon]